jgi:hypothetical protein
VLFGLVITGTVRSEVNVNSSVAMLVTPASVADSLTKKLPFVVAIPEISPVTGSALRPGGRPMALSRAAELPPLVLT